MNNYIVTFEYRVMVTAFAILAMFFISSSNFLFQNWRSLESSKHQKNERIGRTGKAGRAGEIGDPRELRELEELEEPCPQSVLLPKCHIIKRQFINVIVHFVELFKVWQYQ